MNKYLQTIEIIRRVRQETDTAVLYYSAGGKDGIALLDMLAHEFNKVICYYMYIIPNLDHIRPYIHWAYVHYKNVEVRTIKHYQSDYFEKYGLFCEPNENIKTRSVGDVEQYVRDQTGIKYGFSGMKGVDGYMKRMRLKKFAKTGYITDKGMVYPIALWTNKEVLRYIERKNLIKPFVYEQNKCSQGFSPTLPVLLMMKRKYPNDYIKTLAEFPFAEKLIFDYERKQDKTSATYNG